MPLAVGREEIRARQRHDDDVVDHLDDERGAFPHDGSLLVLPPTLGADFGASRLRITLRYHVLRAEDGVARVRWRRNSGLFVPLLRRRAIRQAPQDQRAISIDFLMDISAASATAMRAARSARTLSCQAANSSSLCARRS